jgi:quercetin dioxygenase-like cupin family protein
MRNVARMSVGSAMMTKRVEIGTADLAAPVGIQAFTEAGDRNWAGVVALSPGQRFAGARAGWFEALVLKGEVRLGGVMLGVRDYAGFDAADAPVAGEAGAVLFVFNPEEAAGAETTTSLATTRAWRPSPVAGMQVTELTKQPYRVILTEWSEGTSVHAHDHAAGEEIFVVEGELQQGARRLEAGAWLRYHPGAKHNPRALSKSLVLIRNGHLGA